MRLWHKNLIKVLPRQQLIAQWRECCAIAKNMSKSGTPNHILVNRILDYPLEHFITYTELVINELLKRNYKVSNKSVSAFYDNIDKIYDNYFERTDKNIKFEDIFSDHDGKSWHNKKYLIQCLYNLQEKFDCGGIDINEWTKIANTYTLIVDKFK